MSKKQQFDAIIIGAGQAGVPLATALGGAGRKTALIERSKVGGTCINWGCTPTKTMVASARVAYLARRASDYGVHTGSVDVDMQAVRRRKRHMVAEFHSSTEERIAGSKGVTLIMGEAAFTGPRTLEVHTEHGETQQLEADLIFINTGTRPNIPPLRGLDSVHALDSTSIMELDNLPERLLVLGGGYIGLEFAQMFHRFGSRVTVVNRSERLLGREDRDVAEAVAEILREDGIEILCDTDAVEVVPGEGGSVELTVNSGGEERTLHGSHLLTATGRTPNSDSLNLEAAGVQADKRGYIKVNGKLETNVPGIYALGEANGGPAFTHISYDDYRIICANLLSGRSATTEGRMVPYVVFIDPQLGRVGLGEDEAREQGKEIEVAKIPMKYVARALETDETRGMMKAVVDPESGQILGCAVLGLEGGEVMAQIQIAMMGKLPYTALRDGIFAHPTLAESLNTLFDAMGR